MNTIFHKLTLFHLSLMDTGSISYTKPKRRVFMDGRIQPQFNYVQVYGCYIITEIQNFSYFTSNNFNIRVNYIETCSLLKLKKKTEITFTKLRNLNPNIRARMLASRSQWPRGLRVRLHWSQKRHSTTVWTDSRQGSRKQKLYCLCQRLH
jgi:hypothetical protein